MRISDWSSDVCSSDLRLIGYDASPPDTRRYAHASTIESDLFECRYPLREWGWDRAACIARIEAAGLPVPPKSSCFICGAMQPDEVRARPAWRSEAHTTELQSLMSITYAVFCLKNK